MTLYTGSGGSDCGFSFEQGQRYLVYASAVGTDIPPAYFPEGTLVTGICSRTAPIAQVANDFIALGPGTPVAQMLPTLPNTGEGYLPALAFASTPSLLALALLAALLLSIGVTQRDTRAHLVHPRITWDPVGPCRWIFASDHRPANGAKCIRGLCSDHNRLLPGFPPNSEQHLLRIGVRHGYQSPAAPPVPSRPAAPRA